MLEREHVVFVLHLKQHRLSVTEQAHHQIGVLGFITCWDFLREATQLHRLKQLDGCMVFHRVFYHPTQTVGVAVEHVLNRAAKRTIHTGEFAQHTQALTAIHHVRCGFLEYTAERHVCSVVLPELTLLFCQASSSDHQINCLRTGCVQVILNFPDASRLLIRFFQRIDLLHVHVQSNLLLAFSISLFVFTLLFKD